MNNILSFSGGFSKFKTCVDCVVVFTTFYDIMHVQSVVIFFKFQWCVWGFIKFTFHKLTRKRIGTSKFCKSSRLLKGTLILFKQFLWPWPSTLH